MRFLLFAVLALVAVDSITGLRHTVRKRREIEREGRSSTSETEVISESNKVPEKDSGDAEVINMDVVPNKGIDLDIHFPLAPGDMFGPGYFQRMLKEMRRAMLDLQKRLRTANETLTKYPENHNETKTEIVEINGKKYERTETVVTKSIGGFKTMVRSITLVPVEDSKESGEGGQPDTKPEKESGESKPDKESNSQESGEASKEKSQENKANEGEREGA